ncbi:MAG: hypothetical protein V4487_07445 [Chlamydiota bacterium]
MSCTPFTTLSQVSIPSWMFSQGPSLKEFKKMPFSEQCRKALETLDSDYLQTILDSIDDTLDITNLIPLFRKALDTKDTGALKILCGSKILQEHLFTMSYEEEDSLHIRYKVHSDPRIANQVTFLLPFSRDLAIPDKISRVEKYRLNSHSLNKIIGSKEYENPDRIPYTFEGRIWKEVGDTFFGYL